MTPDPARPSRSRPPAPPGAAQFAWLTFGLLLLTVYGSIIPLRYEPLPLGAAIERVRQAPRADLHLTEARGDWAVNLVQYATLGFCFMGWLAVDRRRPAGLMAAAVAVPAGWALAVGAEVLQVYFPPRTISLNDVVVEGVGATLGAAAWLLAGQAVTGWARRSRGRKGLAGLASQALPAYVALLVVVHAMPFDFVLSRGELAEKAQAGRINLTPFARLALGGPGPYFELLKNAAAFFGFGALLALAPARSGRGWGGALFAGLALAGVIELLRLLAYTRHCDVTDLLTGPPAAALGFALCRRLARSEAWGAGLGRPRAGRPVPARGRLAFAWVALLVVVNWQPFHFSTDPADFRGADPALSDENTAVRGLRRMSWAPFVDYYWGSRYQALDQAVRRLLSFAPLGALLALAYGRREGEGVLMTLVLAAFVGAVIEAGQYFIPERHPGVTDLLLHVAGAWLGYRGTRHVVRALSPAEGGGQAGVVEAPAGARPLLWHPALGPLPAPRPARALQPPREHRPGLLGWVDGLPYWVGASLVAAAGLSLVAGGLLLYRAV